jgi:hypothetical protein
MVNAVDGITVRANSAPVDLGKTFETLFARVDCFWLGHLRADLFQPSIKTRGQFLSPVGIDSGEIGRF